MREITEEEKGDIRDQYNLCLGDFDWFQEELTRRGFKIVKEENPK
jgi:hypothetical protein